MHQHTIRQNRAALLDSVLDRHGNHLAVLPCGHMPEFTGLDHVHRLYAQRQRQHTVIIGRLPAALDMTQHRHARFRSRGLGDLLAQIFTDTAIAHLAAMMLDLQLRAVGRFHRFRYDHQRKVAARGFDILYFLRNAFDRIFNLGDQDHIHPARDPGRQRDMPRVTTHHL